MYSNNGIDVLEPIEMFLSATIDVDRLTMYQTAIDVFKRQEKYTVIESVNSILPNAVDESPADIEMLINTSLCKHFRELLAEYDVIANGGSLPFLTRLAVAVNALDSWDQSQAFVDIASNQEYLPKYRLYQLISDIDTFDEEEYSAVVTMVSMSLLERIAEVHESKVVEQYADEVSTEAIDLTTLRKVARSSNDRIINRMLADGKIRNVLPVPIITALFKEYCDPSTIQPEDLAKELISVYLVSGQTSNVLIEIIKEQLPAIVQDDLLISKVGLLLNRAYQELTT